MSHDKVLSLLKAASSALTEATGIMKDYSSLPLPDSPPSPISPSVSSVSDYVEPRKSSHYTPLELLEYSLDDKKKYSIEAELAKIRMKEIAWSVPGTDENGVPGHRADVAVATSRYGMSIGYCGFMSKNVLGPLGYCRVSEIDWLFSKDISVGKILYTHNTKKVFRGVVTGQPIKGPFCPIRSLENSFIACLGLVSDDQLRSEVEVVFKVDWKGHAELDQKWSEILQRKPNDMSPTLITVEV
jgi:hypothetical protein